jgi:hypothetical protein
MGLGIVSRSFRRGLPGRATMIDGMPLLLRPGSVRYVDGGLLSTGNGSTPNSAHNTLQLAVTAADRDDTIFVRPKAVGNFYTENVIVPPSTKANLSIIGTGNGKGNSVYQACTLRGVLAVDDPILELGSSFADIENLHFWARAAQTHGFGVLGNWNTNQGASATLLNIGSSIINCTSNTDILDAPPGAGVVQSAIRIDSSEGWLVEGCLFQDCRVGVSIGSTVSAAYQILLLNNIFRGVASNIAADVMVSDTSGIDFIGNHFAHAVPSHAAGSMQKYIFQLGGTTVTGGASGNYFGSANAGFATDNSNMTGIIRAGNFYSGGVMTS